MRKLLILTMACLMATAYATAQGTVGLKTNLLYGAGAFAPNLGVKVGLDKRTTLDISGCYNWFNLDGTAENNKKPVHWMV